MAFYSHIPLPSSASPSLSGITYNWGIQYWSGHLTSYRTGDEKWQYDNGFFDYTPPAYPLATARLSDFDVLIDNNIFGNTNRFTNSTGGTVATSGTRVIVDHLHGLDWLRFSAGSINSWNDFIDGALASTNDGGGWVVPGATTIITICNFNYSNWTNHGGFNISGSFSLWTSTTNVGSTSSAHRLQLNSRALNSTTKTSTPQQLLWVRKSLYAV